jgi:hypothetical protein
MVQLARNHPLEKHSKNSYRGCDTMLPVSLSTEACVIVCCSVPHDLPWASPAYAYCLHTTLSMHTAEHACHMRLSRVCPTWSSDASWWLNLRRRCSCISSFNSAGSWFIRLQPQHSTAQRSAAGCRLSAATQTGCSWHALQQQLCEPEHSLKPVCNTGLLYGTQE